VRFSRIQYNSPGRDTGSNASLNAEWARIKNHGGRAKTLTGWTVRSREGRVYTFPTFRLRAGKTVTLHSGHGRNTATDLFWGKNRYVWNNTRDTAVLKNKAKVIVETCRWSRGNGIVACSSP
jgi:hypothetical protein